VCQKYINYFFCTCPIRIEPHVDHSNSIYYKNYSVKYQDLFINSVLQNTKVWHFGVTSQVKKQQFLFNEVIWLNMGTDKSKWWSSVKMVWIVFLIFGWQSCQQPPETTETDKFEKELKNFNQSMSQVGQTMDMVDAMQQEVDMVEQQRASGEITDEQANKLLSEIKQTYGRAIARRSNVNPASGLPAWARTLGLIEPQGLALDADYSQMTSAENPDEGFNSILLVYNGPYQQSMAEAERIARAAKIPVSKDYQEAIELAKTYSSSPMKGIAYMNFDPFVKDNDYNISITVDENGVLTLSAVDALQLKRQFETTPETSEDIPTE